MSSTRTLGTKATAAREALEALAADPPPLPEYLEEVADRFARVVPYDSGAFMTVDPGSLLPTGVLSRGGSPELHRAFSRVEMGDNRGDVGTFHTMIRDRQTAQSLSHLTGGDLQECRRYRDIHVPFGLHDELRILGRSATSTLSASCVSRAADLPDFSAEEVAWAASISATLADGVRRALLRPNRASGPLRGPGMLVLDADGNLEAVTGEARRWLEQLEAPHPGLALPKPIMAVANEAQVKARALAAGGDLDGLCIGAARVRLHTDAGWLLAHADVLHAADGAPGKVAVVLEPADRAELMPLLLALHGLSTREREVAELLVSGLPTDEIAQRLHISRHTLKDHTKAIFAKVGVSSRPELTAAMSQEPLAA